MGDVIDMRRFGGLRHRLPFTLLDLRRRRPGPGGDLPAGRVLQQGRDPPGPQVGLARGGRAGLGLGLRAGLLGRRPHRVHDGLLHRPGVLPDLLGAREAAQPRRPRGPEPEPRLRPRRPRAARRTARTRRTATTTSGHESPPIMTYPLMVLAGCAVLVGLIFGPTHSVRASPEETLGFEALGTGARVRLATALSARWPACSGIGLAYRALCRAEPDPRPAGPAAPAALPGVAQQVLCRRGLRLAWSSSRLRAVAIVCEFLDVYLVDSLVRGIAWLPRLVGRGPAGAATRTA